ncbi:hypothetical protein [Shewanella sp. NIFS-20-20]|nr:hypothetical protein [Shewanella sp. NIFS-20-20]
MLNNLTDMSGATANLKLLVDIKRLLGLRLWQREDKAAFIG